MRQRPTFVDWLQSKRTSNDCDAGRVLAFLDECQGQLTTTTNAVVQSRLNFGRASRLGRAEVGVFRGVRMDRTRCARLGMLESLFAIEGESWAVEAVTTLFRHASHEEQCTILVALDFCCADSHYTDLAIEATRTNASEVFASLALNNSFPAANFPDQPFDQLVLKALFLDLDAAKIIGLQERMSEGLLQTVLAYNREREIANRKVPRGVSVIFDYAKEKNWTQTKESSHAYI